ncbi:hypothetical protein K227x_59310 [Rubripirellula lacrimiformis]|uniref:Uncharacterized protein n=1 Tax=Rubripirellula lacrimiformis TaxID=1930273 RepID=A0A517NK40_9BACT|nr:hypothetical protein [Rubripirellula lacrimiformis]QDT07504.1 hypothetical protein K227x_59310 [Rubripirellula lacrimiformis]
MNSKREERAIDALFVSQLRSNRTDAESHPELNEHDREQLRSLGDDFVNRLFAGEIEEICGTDEVEESGTALCGTAFGLNRAKDIDEETKAELDQKRQEIIDRTKKSKEDHDDADPSE